MSRVESTSLSKCRVKLDVVPTEAQRLAVAGLYGPRGAEEEEEDLCNIPFAFVTPL